jgi:Fe/S biogenesis protein NfuA
MSTGGRIALCPGTYDPVTYGHLDIVERASRLFSHVVVCVAEGSTKKHPLFTADERRNLVQTSIEHLHGATLDYSERQGLIIRNPNKPPAPMVEGLVSDDELSATIETILSTEINPSLAAHGGFVTYVGHDTEGTAYLTMGGGCHGCSMSKVTMLEGVQTTLVEQIEELVRVRDVTDHATGSNPYYK